MLIVDKSEDSVEDSDVQMFKVALRKRRLLYKMKVNKIFPRWFEEKPEIHISLFTEMMMINQ